MTRKIDRRQFLKWLAVGATVATLSPTLYAQAATPIPPYPDDDWGNSPWVLMGRAINPVSFYEQPSVSSRKVWSCGRDRGFRIFGSVHAPYSSHNDLWYETFHGYVPSAWVLPIRVYPPQPFISDVGPWGFWGEVSQIYTLARSQPSLKAGVVYRFYGGTVYHILDSFVDEQGLGWYKIYDDYPPGAKRRQWVLAKDMRRITREEMAPIHPYAKDKRVEVDLSKQLMSCFEGDEVVYTTKVASGLGGEKLFTPRGEMAALLKQPSRHMCNIPYEGGPEPLGDIFDLPGIPWNIFFDLSGTAIHGAYWHNDFGIPRSHGCLNVPCESSRWVYRWIEPLGGFEDDFIQGDYKVGTPILIF